MSAGFLSELKRRNVIRMAGLYLVVAWLLVQVASTVFPAFGIPDWGLRAVILTLVVGFIPTLVFAWVFELTPEGLKRDAEVPISESIGTRTGQRMEHMIVAILVLALGYFCFDKFVLAPKREVLIAATAAASAKEAQLKAGSAIPDKSIAVLPLVNAGGQDQQFFSDGLSEALIVALTQFDGLKVIGRNSAFQFRDSMEGSKAIGGKLGVAHLLEGSVQHAGDTVRINLELINAHSGQVLWSQKFDRPYTDLFALQDEVTQSVAVVLKAKLLSVTSAAQNDRPPSGSLDAYDAYLQGKFYRARGTETDNRKAIEKLSVATRIDPTYAMAWATLADTWMNLSNSFLGGQDLQRGWDEARKATDIALGLAPDLGLAHAVRSRVLAAADFNWQDSAKEARHAAELAPNDASVRFAYSLSLASSGQVNQAVAVVRAGLATDPLDGVTHRQLGRLYFGLGRLDEAEAATRRAIELQPDSPSPRTWLAFIQVQRGEAAAATDTARLIAPGTWRDTALAMALAIGPEQSAADAALRELIDRNAVASAFQVAQVQAMRGDADKTFEWLERARQNRDPAFAIMLFDPFILRYQGDPRFAALCKKVGLPTKTDAKAAGS